MKKYEKEVLSADDADRPFVALIAVVNSSLSPVGRFLKDYLQNDLQQNDYSSIFVGAAPTGACPRGAMIGLAARNNLA